MQVKSRAFGENNHTGKLDHNEKYITLIPETPMKTNGFKDAGECWKAILSDAKRNVGFLEEIKRFATENTDPAKIIFGTSGDRKSVV